jgi:hypothetical protein
MAAPANRTALEFWSLNMDQFGRVIENPTAWTCGANLLYNAQKVTIRAHHFINHEELTSKLELCIILLKSTIELIYFPDYGVPSGSLLEENILRTVPLSTRN